MSARTENVASETLSPAVRPIRPRRKMLVVQAVASISSERGRQRSAHEPVEREQQAGRQQHGVVEPRALARSEEGTPTVTTGGAMNAAMVNIPSRTLSLQASGVGAGLGELGSSASTHLCTHLGRADSIRIRPRDNQQDLGVC